MSGPSFGRFMDSNTRGFDGTRFFLLVDEHNTVPLTIARQPAGEYWDKLLKMFEIARKFNPKIELNIAFCIQYHETQIQNGGWSNNRIFPFKVFEYFPIPENVTRFFQLLQVKILRSNLIRLKIEVRNITLRLEGLEQLQKEFDESVKETTHLQPEMAECQSELEKAEQDLEALMRLKSACKEVQTRFQQLKAQSPLFREEKLMAETKEKRDRLFEKLRAFSEQNRRLSKQREELSSLRNDQQSLLNLLERSKVELEKSERLYFASFEKLYPRTPNVLESADFHDCLKRIESASDPCDDAWKDFRRSDFIWDIKLPVLVGLMMTKMVETSLLKSMLLKPMPLLSFQGLFGKLPIDMQELYVPHRFWVINHSFLLILSSKLTNTCMGRRFSLKIQMRFLMKLTNKMLFRFSVEFFKLHRLSI